MDPTLGKKIEKPLSLVIREHKRMNRISQMEPWIGDEEKQAMIEYLDSGGWLTEFRKTREFEQMIGDYVDSKFVSVVSNGTVSLFIACAALGIGSGDEVIVPDYTMVASPNAVVLAGAKPVFVDIDMANLCMDPELAEEAITERTKAIMLVTINGRYPDMDKAVALARKHDLFLIEDAAQSLGSRHQGKHLGTFGDIGSFSFSVPKIITTGQGGALVTDNEELYEKIRRIKDFGRSRGGIDYYETLGYNFKFTDLQAVIGIEQMRKLDWRVQRKKEMFACYQRHLEDVSDVEFIKTDLEDTSPWFIDILVSDPSDLGEYLKKQGIGTRPFYPPLHSQPPYGFTGRYPNTEYVSAHGLWLPSSSFLSHEDIGYICNTIKSHLGK